MNNNFVENDKTPSGFNLSQRGSFRIAVIAEDLHPPLDEGAKKMTFSLINSLKKIGADVSVFTRDKNLLLENAHPLPANKILFGYSFSRELRNQSPEAILYVPASSGTPGAFIRAAAIKIQSPKKILGLLSLQHRKIPPMARRAGLYRYADIVFTQSQASAAVFRSLNCETAVLPAGVDHSVFQPATKAEKHLLRLKYGFRDEDRLVLHIGHCNRNRNVTALTRLSDSGLKVILIVSTSTITDDDLLSELRRSGVTVITGFIEAIRDFYQIADCYLFPVISTTSAIDAPLSVLEAMACNLPVVTTRFGALPDMFEAGNGFYFGSTEDDLVKLVTEALKERNCKTSAMVSNYSWDNAALAILETLKQAENRTARAGMLICFTGIDGSGKTTQADLLLNWLKSKGVKSAYVWSRGEVLAVRRFFLFWGRKALGTSAQEIAGSQKSHDDYQSRKSNLMKNPLVRTLWSVMTSVEHLIQINLEIRRKLYDGYVVVCDRYIWDSTIDMAILNNKKPQSLSGRLNRFVWSLVPKPSLVFFINVSPEEAMKRKNDIPSLDYVKTRAEFYQYLAQRDSLTMVNGCKKAAIIQDEIIATVRKYVER